MHKLPDPWQTLTTAIEFDNPWFTVTTHDTIAPDGSHPRYGKISFKNRAVAVIPVDTEQHTWLVGQWRFPLGNYSWELPMGGAPRNENLELAALRELREETGLVAGRVQQIMKLYPSNSITDEEGYVFVAEELTPGNPEFDVTEQLEVRRLPLTEALAMVTDGSITDAISIAGLLQYARMHGL
ncbi:MAG: NUDIX hydrolase [Gammaproteobacteria bacterium]